MKIIRENYPIYPLTIAILHKLKVRVGTRRFYVDVPYLMYQFLFNQIDKHKGSKEIRSEWKKFLRSNKEALVFRGKPLANVYPEYQPSADAQFLILRINWEILLKYLEYKANEYSRSILRNGGEIGNFYEELWRNFFSLGGRVLTLDKRVTYLNRERFKKFLQATGDYEEITRYIEDIEKSVNQLYMLKKHIPSVELYVVMLTSYVNEMLIALDVINPQLICLLMRSLLEYLIKFAVYLHAGRIVGVPEAILAFTFYNDYIQEKRTYSAKKFVNELVNKYKRVYKKNPRIGIRELLNELIKMNVKKLMIGRETINEFTDMYELSKIKEYLTNIYSACSWVIHNKPQLPFNSPLEIKLVKHIIKSYVQTLTEIITAITNTTTSQN